MTDSSAERRTIGGFELVDVLGQGAFGTVYRALQPDLDREVALKVLDPEWAGRPEIARRFAQEGAVAARLDHPSIVPVYRAGNDNGTLYLAMRLVRGPSLGAVLQERGQLAYEDVIAVVRATGDALDHAHAAGLVHRDVKPANILIEGSLPHAHVWLVDLGIAKILDSSDHLTAEGIGTAFYMAPEQAEAGSIDGRADLYSLGCVAYECLTGHKPFSGETVVNVLVGHASAPVPPVGEPTLDAFFAVALAKRPDERFTTGAAMSAELARAVDGAAPLATPAIPGALATGPQFSPDAPTDLLSPGIGPSAGTPATTGQRHRSRLGVGIAAFVAVVVAAVTVYAWSRPREVNEAQPPAPTTSSSIVSATTTLAPTTTRVVQLSTASADTGPARVVDPQGIAFDLLPGWRIAQVTAATGLTTTLARNDAFGGWVTSSLDAPASAGDLVKPSTCSTVAESTTLAGVPALRCTVQLPTAPGATDTRAIETYLAVNAGHSFIVQVPADLPAGDRETFLQSISFT